MYFSTKSKTSILLAAIIIAAGTLIQVSAYELFENLKRCQGRVKRLRFKLNSNTGRKEFVPISVLNITSWY